MNAAEFAALPDVNRISDSAAAYLALQRTAPQADSMASPFAGKLILCVGLNERGIAYSLAMSIAGGTFLGIDPQPERLKAAMRDGVCDYMVNSLDEALRVLKNEIRKKTPVSVGLLGTPLSVLTEAAQRGLQPDYFLVDRESQQQSGVQIFCRRGAVDLSATPQIQGSEQLVIASTSATAAMNAFERAAEDALDGARTYQVKWRQSSPRYFRRTTPAMRSALMDAQQIARLEQRLLSAPLASDLTLAVQADAGGWQLKSFAAGA